MNSLKGEEPKKSQNTSQAKLVKELLAQYLGLEPEDINDDDSLTIDFHMSATDLVDFIESLNTYKIDTSQLDLTKIETFGELVETLVSEEYL